MGRPLTILRSALAVLLALTHFAAAQETLNFQSPVLVIDSDQLYINSDYGKRIREEIEAENAKIIDENQRIASELEAEELALTEQRPTLDAAEFRDLADAFDEKVQIIRREQEVKARLIVRKQEDSRRAFLNIVAPILESIMSEVGAAVILERRQVLLFRNAVDITWLAGSRIDAEVGDGADLPEPAQEE